MQLRSALLAATVLATPLAASAQPVTGLYVGAGVGVNIMSQEDVKSVNVGPIGWLSGLYRHHGTAVPALAVWSRRLGLRQWAPRRDRGQLPQQPPRRSIRRLLRRPVGSLLAVGGTEQKFGGMVNVLYDFNGVAPWVVPYLGVGVGYAGINEKWSVHNSSRSRRR